MRVKSSRSRRNFQYPRVDQFYTYPENFMTLTQLTSDLWPTFRDHVWPESRFGVCRFALASHIVAEFSWLEAFKHVIWCWSQALGRVSRSPGGQVRSLTFDDLGSLFRFLHASRLVFLAEFEFSNHLNIYGVVLVSLFTEAVRGGWRLLRIPGRTPTGWPDLTWPDLA